MYCSTCGTEIQTALNYCKNCGARIDKSAGESGTATVLQYLSMGAGFVGLGGLGLTLALIAILLKNKVVPELIVVLAALFVILIFAICFMMIQQISKLISSSPVSNDKFSERNTPERVSPANTAQLNEAREPLMSVTDTTTKSLDEVLVKRS
jgi:uncharacterized membrane protein YvbJ